MAMKLKCQREGCDNYLNKGKYYCSISCSQKGISKPKISKALSGRKNPKHSERMKKWWRNSDNKEKMIENNPTLQKGHIPWNKGIPQTKETKQLLSNIIKKQFKDGRELSETTFKKGHISWNKGIKYTEERLEKMSEMMKEYWNSLSEEERKFTEEHKQNISKSKKGKYAGELSWNWRGGKSYEPYSPEFNKELKNFIKQRDLNICQTPNCMNDENLHTHHIDYDKKNNDPKNLITLCASCHTKTNFNRKYYQNYYKEILEVYL